MRAPIATAAVLLTVLPATAAGAPRHPGKADGKAAIEEIHALGKGKGVHTGFELSPAMAQLTPALRSRAARDRVRAESILARPDDSQRDPADAHKWSVPEAPGSPFCLVHF